MNRPQTTVPTVIIIEDDASTRDGLATLLTAAHYRCLGFASGEEFLAEPLPQGPCCLLLDLQLHGQDGLAVQAELNRRNTSFPVLFLTGHASIDCAVSAMKAGAMDFLQKPFDSEALLRSIGRAFKFSGLDLDRRRTNEHDAALLAALTRREHETLSLLVGGSLNKEVARVLGISVRTVETHRKHVMDKLEARTLADLVRVWMNNDFATRIDNRETDAPPEQPQRPASNAR